MYVYRLTKNTNICLRKLGKLEENSDKQFYEIQKILNDYNGKLKRY